MELARAATFFGSATRRMAGDFCHAADTGTTLPQSLISPAHLCRNFALNWRPILVGLRRFGDAVEAFVLKVRKPGRSGNALSLSEIVFVGCGVTLWRPTRAC